MNKLKQMLLAQLAENGVLTEAGKEWRPGKLVEEKGAFLSLRQATAEQGALCRYLGCDAHGAEVYGMRMEIEFALVLLSPKAGGGAGAEEFAEQVFDGLLNASGNLGLREISCGEAGYDSLRDCFRQEIRAKCLVMAYATKTDEGMCLEEFRIQAAWK